MNKGILAKLLAKENITIQHGNYHTAWFDIKNRVLGLPNWKDMGKDVYDLLIGHEVGHALETPFEGWHDSPEQLEGCPRSYINVIEDARIERKVKSRYPGLVNSFSKGYRKLFDNEFFGDLSDIDWNQTKLIDKINLKAKIGNLIDVPFNSEEQVFMDRAMTTDSFDEVVQLCRDVLAYTKENQEELMKPPASQGNDEDENNNNENEDPTSNMGHDDMESNDEEQEKQQPQAPSKDSDEEGEESLEGEKETERSHGGDEDVSITDENYRRSEESLLEKPKEGEKEIIVCNEFNKDIRKRVVFDYETISKDRAQRTANYIEYSKSQYTDEYPDRALERFAQAEMEFPGYIRDVKKDVNYAVKEFEMRKAAYRYTRAQTARTGSIDVNKLWSYKTNDDIFSRVTQLADAKNHGMFMLIDFSGSMSGTMHKVIDQLIHTIMFCKAVNIPFDVYGFTTTNYDIKSWEQTDTELHHENLALVQQIHSGLKKKDFEEAIKFLHRRMIMEKCWGGARIYEYGSKFEDWGSTPLNTSLVMCTRLVKAFRAKHNIENMNFVVMSDGDTNGMNIHRDQKLDDKRMILSKYSWDKTFVINVDGRKVKTKGLRTDATKALLENLQKNYGVTTLGFFLAQDQWDYKRKLGDVAQEQNLLDWDDEQDFKKSAQKMMSRQKVCTFDNVLGYNQFYVLKAKQMDIETEEFEVEEDATKGKLTQAFKKHSKSKKLNKTLLTNFGKAVAM